VWHGGYKACGLSTTKACRQLPGQKKKKQPSRSPGQCAYTTLRRAVPGRSTRQSRHPPRLADAKATGIAPGSALVFQGDRRLTDVESPPVDEGHADQQAPREPQPPCEPRS